MNNQLEKKNQDTMKKVFKLIRPYMHYLILSLIFAAISVALTLYAPILSGNAIDLILCRCISDFKKVCGCDHFDRCGTMAYEFM